ncbi:ATP-binding cassette domain-containing protein [Bosea sp. CS1GBMeth4]|uniref:ATP-binding cassette domain-containing protein n=1 Tax=Bosea sp. CS1GBMeth4 TaxID=1892849 RepID=UPI0016471DB9|nr:ATP-binding cassette domain-containing protein [Bosea sp. CS1GBMeth4]
MSDIAIRVDGLVKEYEVYAKPIDLAVEVLTRRKRHKVFRALDGVSFQVARGEVLGIIGSNGAGKSTLLKVITGVLEPTYGKVDISGRVTAILELGLGFNPEYSGRENIYLSGLLYGMDRDEIDRKIEEIIDFSGLAEFIERPVKTYSSGMHSRLAFSIATAVEPDILIIDEALAAGDSAFVQKCMRRIRNLCSGGRTVLLVSHGTGLLAQLCQRVIWMEHGQVRMIGPAINVVQAYDLTAHQQADSASWIETVDDDLDTRAGTESGRQTAELTVEAPTAEPPSGSSSLKDIVEAAGDGERHIFRRGPVFIDSVEMLDALGELTTRLTLLKPFTLRIHYRVEGDVPEETLGVALAVNGRYDLSAVAQYFTQNIRPGETRDTYFDASDRKRPAEKGVVILEFDYTPFRKGEYFLSIGLVPNTPGTWEFYEYRHFYYPFSVDDAGMDVGAPVFFDARLTHLRGVDGASAISAKSDETSESVGTAIEAAPADGELPASIEAGAEAPTEAQSLTLRGEIEAICFGNGGYPEKWPRHKRCPACTGGPLTPVFEKYGFSHARCADCGFVCVDPFPPDDILKKLYAGAYYTRTRELFELPLLKEGGVGTPFSAPLEVLREIVDRATAGLQRGAWLDVGGGLGAFANLIQEMRPDWKVTLNELNPQSIEIARSLFNFDVVNDDPAKLLAAGERFDVVSSVAVLEHIPEPYEFLTSYARLVRPGGWLVTVVPHFSELNATLSQGSSANVVPPYHVSLFNERALKGLMSRVPDIELVSVEQFGPAAFDLIHHPDTGDYWDITIPSASNPVPRSIMLEPYEHEKAVTLNALQKTAPLLSEFFAKHDGRLYLAAFCRRR